MERMPGIHFKKCCTCKAVKPIAVFYKDKGQKDGHEPRCKICRKASVKKTWSKYKKSYSVTQKEWRSKNREKSRIVERKSYRKLFAKFPGRYRQKCMIRQKNISKASIFKNELPDIEQMYSDCKKNESVDHVIPLNHPLVCGLHVLNNLQILTVLANSIKNNKIDLNSISIWPTCKWPREDGA